MGQTGWRLPDDLLKRVRVHCAQTGERQNEFVRQALEKALGLPPQGDAPERVGETRGSGFSTPAPPRTPAKKTTTLTAIPALKERHESLIPPRLGKGYVPPRPKGK